MCSERAVHGDGNRERALAHRSHKRGHSRQAGQREDFQVGKKQFVFRTKFPLEHLRTLLTDRSAS
jgi:hypothetical protein